MKKLIIIILLIMMFLPAIQADYIEYLLKSMKKKIDYYTLRELNATIKKLEYLRKKAMRSDDLQKALLLKNIVEKLRKLPKLDLSQIYQVEPTGQARPIKIMRHRRSTGNRKAIPKIPSPSHDGSSRSRAARGVKSETFVYVRDAVW